MDKFGQKIYILQANPRDINVQPGDYRQLSIVYLKVAERIDLKSSITRKKIATMCGMDVS